MKLRAVTAFVGASFLIAACGGGTDETTTTADEVTDANSPTELAMSDVVESVEQVPGSNEPLDDICRRQFAGAAVDDGLTVGLVSDVASIDDGTFNQAAFEGMEAAGRCFGVETTFLESAGDDAEAQISSMLAKEVDIVVTVGFQFQDATVEAAGSRPDVRFVGVDQLNPDELDNYVAISFRNDQVGFLAGAMAALLTETGTVAVVAGPDVVPPVVAIADGFETGALHVADDVTVLKQHLDSFTDPAAGASQASDFIEQGADVVFGAAGDTGTGATRSAAAAGSRVIGVDQDEFYTTFAGGAEAHSEQLVTSAIKRVDLGVFLTIAAMASGDVEGGGFLLDASNGGVTYAPFHEADVPADVATALEDLRQALAADEIDLSGEG